MPENGSKGGSKPGAKGRSSGSPGGRRNGASNGRPSNSRAANGRPKGPCAGGPDRGGSAKTGPRQGSASRSEDRDSREQRGIASRGSDRPERSNRGQGRRDNPLQKDARSERPRSDRPRRDDRRKDGPRSDRPPRNGGKPRRDGQPRDQRSEDDRDAGPSPREKAAQKVAEMEAKVPGLASRRAALDVLGLIRKGQTLDQALYDCRTYGALEGPDRSFARNLVSTTLRRRGSLDDIIGTYLDKPLARQSIEVQDILRIVTAQLLLLDVPAHAAVDTSVRLTGHKQETAGYRNLVNAIARKIGDKGPAQLAKLPLRVDTPGWLWRSWSRAYGPVKTQEIATAHQTIAPLDLRLKDPTDASLFEDLSEKDSLMPGHIRLPGKSDVQSLPGYGDGKWWVQDFAASLPATLLGNITGKEVFDLCAAPGGKTLQLAAAGANVSAVDISGARLKRLAENLERTGLDAQTVKADILEWEPENLADIVLLDAPCSATGTIRRHPDVTWSKAEDEVRQLAQLQGQFIDKALTFLKPGGILLYCTCSLQPDEGEAQIRAALSRHNGIEVNHIAPSEVTIEGAITKEGYLRTLPGMVLERGGMDGFFAARIIRK